MKQVIQNYHNGGLSVEEVPSPLLKEGGALVRTLCSVISAGTERAVMQFAGKGLMGKARSRPDLVKQVVRKVNSEGLISAYKASMSRLDIPLPMGYSSSGEILEVGKSVGEFHVGDRVACAGGGYASHSEIIFMPRNLMARIPEGVSDEDASFATIGAIALQGVRIADLRLGEKVVVIGLGILGLLTVQIVKAAGCNVLGTDLNERRVNLAKELGADHAMVTDPEGIGETVMAFTGGYGADAVIIVAATKSNVPTELAGEISRLKGRVIAVGDVGMDIPRRVYYPKELEYRISMSYGPGRYDPSYEEKGIDYPYPYVPFTEQRNMETFLNLVKERKVTPSRLVTHRFSLHEAQQAYDLLKDEDNENNLGVLFTYPGEALLRSRVDTTIEKRAIPIERSVRLGLIGAGDYAKLILLPNLAKMRKVCLLGVSTTTGLSCRHVADKYGFHFCATDNEEILGNDDINTVIIATRHNLHAELTIRALKAGKHVFVEKPLAINEDDLLKVSDTFKSSDRFLMVGFNRRFAYLAAEAKRAFTPHASPLSMVYRVNAGAVPKEHWTQDIEEGGGRVIGEVCHFVDFLQFICGSAPASVYAAATKAGDGKPEDNLTVTICFNDGSVGIIAYLSTGDKAIPKEYIEIYGEGKTFIIDDFRKARYAKGGNIKTIHKKTQNKGHALELKAFVEAICEKGNPPIPFNDVVYSTLATFRILDSLESNSVVPVEWFAHRK